MPRDTLGSRGYHSVMATASDIPSLDGLLDSILDQLSTDAVASIAAMRPRAARKRETFAEQLVRMVQAKARIRIDEGEVKPLPDEPEFNEETKQAIRDVEAGRNLTRHDTLAEAFADLGI